MRGETERLRTISPTKEGKDCAHPDLNREGGILPILQESAMCSFRGSRFRNRLFPFGSPIVPNIYRSQIGSAARAFDLIIRLSDYGLQTVCQEISYNQSNYFLDRRHEK